ncbi:MAG: glycosyltransferase [Kiritimatiellae bacterium]|nr:glycosyltransferase [Kiritimatiellia bacterium]
MKSLSLVIPVYNAEGLLKRILSHVPLLAESAEKSGFCLLEVIVVDDGSKNPVIAGGYGDLLPQKVELRSVRNEKNRGKGFSVRRGALLAKGDWVLMSDVDESSPLTEFASLAKQANNAIVCGSRKGGIDMRPWYRKILSAIFNSLTGLDVEDSQCGFKLFNMPLMRPCFEKQKIHGFAFDVELISKAPSVSSVHVKWQGRRRSSLRVWRDAPRMLWDLIRIRLGF